MATGIIAIARRPAGHRLARRARSTSSPPSRYVVLVVLFVAPARPVPAPLRSPTSPATPRASPSSPSSPPPTCSAARSALIHGWWDLAWVLWWRQHRAVGRARSTRTLIAVVLRDAKPGLGAGINGTWFLLTVSTESIAVLGALLLGRRTRATCSRSRASPRSRSASSLYLIVMTMVFLRWTFQPLEPDRSRPAGVDRRRRRRHHRPRRLQPARRPRPSRRASTGSRPSSKASSRWPGPRPRSGSRS